MSSQIQCNCFIITGNTCVRPVVQIDILQQGDRCTILCCVHRLLKVRAVGNRVILLCHFHGHLRIADRTGIVVFIHCIVRANIVAGGALAVFKGLVRAGEAAGALV